jgi:hypothetical protein
VIEEGMDESDEEDDTAIQMNACGEAPETPPAGFTYAPCPPLDTLTDKAALVGRRVLTARIDDGACGWFIGTVTGSGVGKAVKKKVPTATHVIEYKTKETGTKVLNGKVGSELSTSNYGGQEWWLLLEPMVV